ncbi:MAG: hypothetical protein JNM93_05300 [Bacteriovoracaceae bacterium]|nr:hypothetical protein [Bacteriovoracaceae bacterium]
MSKKLKTEHTGAKNGGGYWGTRHEAKTVVKRLRRRRNKDIIKNEIALIELTLKKT